MTDQPIVPSFDTATLNQPPNFPFSFANVPTAVPIRMFFVTGGFVYPLYIGNTNVFTFTSGGTVDLGLVETDSASGKAEPGFPPNNITLGQEKQGIPAIVVPPTASVLVTSPSGGAQVQGPDVTITFSLQNFTIGNQNQAHLHVYLDNDPTPYEFLNAAPVLHNGIPAANAQWVSATQIRFIGLSTDSNHTVQFNLATASHTEFVAPGMDSVQFFVLPPPANPATINVTAPTDNQALPFGPVTVAFNVANFAIQGQGQPQLHFYLDANNSNLYQFLNNGTGQVLLNGNPTADVEWVTTSSFRFNTLSGGAHSLRLVLANGDAANTELTNSQATDIVNFTVDAPPVASVMVTSGSVFLSSPVRISFAVTNFTIGLPGTPHLRFSINSGALHDFYNGPGINSDNGVLLNGVHDHAVHWTSTTSFDLFGLPARPHQVRLVLVDASNTELAGTSVTHNFTVQQPPTGELQLEPVLGNLSFPVGLSLAPDGRIFYNERLTGAIRVINPGWQLVSTPFCEVSIEVNGEQGLLGLTLDPGFSPSNESVYVYYTAQGPVNRVSKLTRDSNGICDEVIILNNLPTSINHNGGIIQFGPDGKLYVIIGDVENPANAPDINSLAGKILRVDPDGSAPPDNPFFSSANANAKKVYSLGHRNSFGFTFHPQTGDLWESENGESDNDEVNRVIAGGNYGWDNNQQGGFLNKPCCVNPIVAFNPVIAPTGIIAVPENSAIYPPAYRNNLLMAAWNDGTIRLVIPNASDPDQPGSTTVAFTGGQGGLLSFMLGSDGYIYVTNGLFSGTFPFNTSSIFRVIPH
jgi:glucose/arabinose dehydrogenase